MAGPPHVYYTSYENHIEDTSNTVLATVECQTQYFLPTWVIWQKNGLEIRVDGQSYETLQIVTDREFSHYQNILIVRDAVGVVGTPLYTCVVGNYAGNTSSNIRMRIFDLWVSLSGIYTYINNFYV